MDKDKKFLAEGWGTRHTFAFLGFFGFFFAYGMRFNLSLAIVSMVDHSHALVSSLGSKDAQSILKEHHEVCPSHIELQNIFVPANTTSFQKVAKDYIDNEKSLSSNAKTFNWTEAEQGLILGSFFFGYVITQYPGGRIAHLYGAKWIFSVGLLLTAVLTILLPTVTETWGKNGLLILRFLQGLFEGVIFPAMHVMIGRWAPPEERSRITNFVFCGIPFGSAVTMITGGYLIQCFGWQSLFYVAGISTIVWFIFWSLLVFDYPSHHPRISEKELKFIEDAMQGQAINEHIPTPWKAILTSPPVWAILIIHVGHTWGHYLLHAEVPKYLHAVHNFEIEHNGWFAALPQLLNFATCIIMSQLSDYLIVKRITSVLFTRKMCATVATWGSAAAFLGMILGGCNTFVAVISLNIAGAVLGAGYGAWVVNNIDIAPNHAGTMMGISNSFSNCLGFLAPYVSGLILNGNPSLNGWKIVFLIPAVINIAVNIIYMIYADSKEMPWNRLPIKI